MSGQPAQEQTADAPQRPAHRRVAAVWLALMAVGMAYAAVQLKGKDAVPAFNASSAWVGKAARGVEENLQLPFKEPLETADAAWRYRMLGQLGPQVLQGCPGWLFYADGLRSPPGTDLAEAQAVRVQVMHKVASELRARGVQLLVVTVPDKSRIATRQLCGLSRPAPSQMQLQGFVQALDDAAVAHVDLRAALAEATLPLPYYRTDVHLDQAGAERAARAVADAAKPLLGGEGTQEYTISEAASEQPRMGDLIVLAGLERAPNGWRPALDTEVPQTIQMVASGGLLDDGPTARILLAGSSNSRRSNFAEQLGRHLHEPILNQSRDGGKFADAVLDVLKTPLPEGLQLVVWELSEMSLLQPLSALERETVGMPSAANASQGH